MRISLKAARVNANLTQVDAAKKLDISKSTLQNWESGKSFPNAESIKAIESLYGVNYDQLIFCPKITLKA